MSLVCGIRVHVYSPPGYFLLSEQAIKEPIGQSPHISAADSKSGENFIGSGNMITCITVDESPTV